jgi:hypothetical protein
MRKGLIVITAIGLLFTFCGYSLAQEQSEKSVVSSKSANSHKGDKGLCFSVSGLSTVSIGQYEGGIGGKYWVSNKMALIGSIGGNAQKQTSSSTAANYTDSKYTASTCSFFAGVEDHFFIKNKISPYLGGGMRFGIGRYTSYNSLPKDNPPPTATKKTTRSSWSVGVRGSFGIEFFFADWVSLSGQYQIDYNTGSTTNKAILVSGESATNPNDYKYTSFTLGTSTSSLVATFYIW